MFLNKPQDEIGFIEFAPENWLEIGGHWKRILDRAVERYPITCHGLSLSLGSPEPLDFKFIKRLKKFFAQINPLIYSEHLSYTKCDNAHTYELLPIPFRRDAVKHLVSRIKTVQNMLERKIAIENVSYYASLAPEMDEATFVRTIVEEADCQLLLDVNNVYVNAFNHHYDAKAFIQKLPLDRVAYIHMAGHLQKNPTLIIDTHGEAIIDPVFELFAWTLAHLKPVPVMLERDFNFPDETELLAELKRLREIMTKQWSQAHAA